MRGGEAVVTAARFACPSATGGTESTTDFFVVVDTTAAGGVWPAEEGDLDFCTKYNEDEWNAMCE